jgi:putative membrane protein
MYIKRHYSLKIMLSWTWTGIVFFFCMALIPVLLFDLFDWKWLTLPWLPIALVGTALAFITGFKNNAAYDRAWEARQIYGSIVNSSRKFTLMINDYITGDFATEPVSEGVLFEVRMRLANYHIAWLTAMRHNLRQTKPWEAAQMIRMDLKMRRLYQVHEFLSGVQEDLKNFLVNEDYRYVMNKSNKAAACMKLQSNFLQELKLKGFLEPFRHMQVTNLLGELIDAQGRAERIKNFPYPRQFATLNNYLLWVFTILLPFGVMSEFERIGKAIVINDDSSSFMHWMHNHFVWLAIPFSIIISWIFYTLERVGDVTENPFVGLANDVPITTISRAIEIEMLELIGVDKDSIPKPVEPVFDISM